MPDGLETVPPARAMGDADHELQPLEWEAANTYVTMRCSCGQRIADFRPERGGALEKALGKFEQHVQRKRKTREQAH